MGINLRSAIAALVTAVFVQGLSIGLIAPNVPKGLCQPTTAQAFRYTYPAYLQVQLHNTDGAVRVESHDQDHITIEGEIRAFTQGSYDKAHLDKYLQGLIHIEQGHHQLQIISEPQSRPDFLDIEVHYRIKVPENTNLALEESNGNVHVGPNCGRVLVDGNNTDINIEAPLGPVEVQTANGRVRIQDAQDETIVETVNGNIQAHMQAGTLQATTANGSITAHLLQSDVGAVELTAMNGGITMIADPSFGAMVNAASTKGLVQSEIPINGQDALLKRHEVRGEIGDGAARVFLSSLNGDIEIKRSTL